MCELLGLCFNKKVNTRISFGEFRLHSEDNWEKRRMGNPDGWGLAFYPDKSARIFKEPITAMKSQLTDFIREYEEIRSKIFISHIRRKSGSNVSYCNTHPFSRELGGQDFVFAHNGTLHGYKDEKKGLDIQFGAYKPVGQTDSEWAFSWLMERIRLNFLKEFVKMNEISWTNEKFKWLHSELKKINEFGSFNCLFSDGKRLFAYHDMNGYNSLMYLERKSPYGPIRLDDDDFLIDLKEEKDPDEQGIIIATSNLTDEAWFEFELGQLIVVDNGDIIYR